MLFNVLGTNIKVFEFCKTCIKDFSSMFWSTVWSGVAQQM